MDKRHVIMSHLHVCTILENIMRRKRNGIKIEIPVIIYFDVFLLSTAPCFSRCVSRVMRTACHPYHPHF